MKNKYKNKKVVIDGITFDSTKEANRYCELKLLLRAGEIRDLEMQPKFILQEGYEKDGKKIRPIIYVADFKYFDINKMQYIIEDVKGFMGIPVYRLKKKLFHYKYPEYTIIEI